MGYFNFDYDLVSAVADTKKIKEVENFFANKGNHKKITGFYKVSITLKNPNNDASQISRIEISDIYESFYDDKLFAKKLSSALLSGHIDLYFTSEDGDHWGYRVEPNKVYTMSVAWVVDDPNYLLNS